MPSSFLGATVRSLAGIVLSMIGFFSTWMRWKTLGCDFPPEGERVTGQGLTEGEGCLGGDDCPGSSFTLR